MAAGAAVTAPAMIALVEAYLAHRRGLGVALRIAGQQLLSFARFADASGHTGPLTLDLVVRWATQPGRHARQFPARRLEIVRPFARYRAAFEPATEVPPRGLLGPARRRPVHHLYTPTEIAALVAAAGALAPATGLRPATYATLFGLLAAAGLRVSEALRLSPHTFRHTTAMHLLQAGVDITVIALWLGHESPTTTHRYIEADLAMKRHALAALTEPAAHTTRFTPSDDLLAFLEGL